MTAARHLKAVQKSDRPVPRLRLVETSGFRKSLPTHDYVEEHVLSLAYKRFGNQARKKELAKNYEASGELACRRIREFAHDIGAEYGFEFGWKTIAAERCGLPYTTLWNIIQETVLTVSPQTVDVVVLASGIPAKLFYDAEA